MQQEIPIQEPLLYVQNLRTLFPVARGIVDTLLRRPRRFVHAVDGVSLSLNNGEILGLVGESGSGKTTTALNVLGLVEPTEGEIRFNGQDLRTLIRGSNKLALRRQMQIVFQDPYESLNPHQTVLEIVAEPLEIHGLAKDLTQKLALVSDALSTAGLKPPKTFLHRYPEELSGGQRQRVVIAGALVLNPKLLVADEPVSMLDVSIRAEILNVLLQLRNERGIAILYITHDLATAGFFTDRIAVMYLGRVVEIGPTQDVLSDPKHPYTQALLSVIPVPNPRRRRKRLILQGETPNPIILPQGCRFHPRCPMVFDQCKQVSPNLEQVGPGHQAACLLNRHDPARE